MNDQVDEIKSKNDIVNIIGDRVELKKAGSNFKALCPFHSEKTPSFMVSPELQIYKCFGCGKSGDIIQFLEEYEGMEFYEALKYLAQRAGIKIKSQQTQVKGIKERLYDINYLAAKFYHFVLLKHPSGKAALSYLLSDRGLDTKLIEKFQLGYSPNQPLALRKFIIDRNKITPKELEEAGIVYLKNGQGFDRFRGRIIFPLFDHRGNGVGFAGRILPSDANKDLAKYINTPETAVYHKSSLLYGLNETRQDIKRTGEAFVVEGELDMISTWNAGIKNVVAIKGSALTEEQVRLLSRFAKSLILGLDTDLAGSEAARRGIKIAEGQGFEIKVAKFGIYKDPDEAARSDPQGFREFIKKAVGVWDFVIDSVFSKYSGETGEQKAKISKELVPILAAIEDKIVQAHYLGVLAKRLKVPTEAVNEQVEGFSKKIVRPKEKFEVINMAKKNDRREVLEDRLLAILFRLDPSDLLKKETSELLTTPFAKKIVLEYARYMSDRKKFDPASFAKSLPGELTARFSDFLLNDSDKYLDDSEEELNRERDLVKQELKVLDVKNRLNSIQEKIQTMESTGEKKGEELAKLEKEFTLQTQKLFELEAQNVKGIILMK